MRCKTTAGPERRCRRIDGLGTCAGLLPDHDPPLVKRRALLRLLSRLGIGAPVWWAMFAATGCATGDVAGPALHSERRPAAAPATGRVFTRVEMQVRTSSRYFGDEAYAEVNSAWLKPFYARFRSELSRLGIVKWDERFDCNRFVELYTGLAQADFYRCNFHSDTKARALALGPYWYVRANGKGSHAVVQILTERGRIFVDPQTGAEVNLTPQETRVAYFQFF